MKSSIFLAGPINGAESWRTKLINTLVKDEKLGASFIEHTPNKVNHHYPSIGSTMLSNHDINILNPQSIEPKEKFTNDRHNLQIKWETEHLKIADILVFNIPSFEHEVTNYAKTTRFELGEWISKISGFYKLTDKHRDTLSQVGLYVSCPILILYVDESFDGAYYFIKRITDLYLEIPEINKGIILTNSYDELVSVLKNYILTGVQL